MCFANQQKPTTQHQT